LEYALRAPIIVDPRWPDVPKTLRTLAVAHRLANAVECVESDPRVSRPPGAGGRDTGRF